MRGLLRGIVAIVVGVFAFTSPVSAATTGSGETVITAQVMPVRHIVVDGEGVIQRIVSNTSENVTPHVYLDNFGSSEIPMTDDIRTRYERTIAHLDMSRSADYVRKPPLSLLLAYIQHVGAMQLELISQIKLPRPLL